MSQPKQRLVDVQYSVSVEVASSAASEPASFVDLVLHHEDRLVAPGAAGDAREPLRLELSLAEFAQLKKAVDAVDALVRGGAQ